MTKRVRLGQKGQGAVEFALTVLIFLAFMVVLSDMVRICYNWVCLQYAVNEGARFGSLGQTSADITKKVTDIASSLGVKNAQVSVGDLGSTPLSFSRLEASTDITLNPVSDLILGITGKYNSKPYHVTADTMVRNEPFAS